jgi:transposase-like protein
VRWYLRYSLSYRDVEELLVERGVQVDHVTVFRWVQRFAPLLADAARFARHLPGDRWFVDETYIKVNGVWRYVYRAVDQYGQVIDVLVSARRDADAARRFFQRAIAVLKVKPTEVVTDAAAVYPAVLDELVPQAWHRVEPYATDEIVKVGWRRSCSQRWCACRPGQCGRSGLPGGGDGLVGQFGLFGEASLGVADGFEGVPGCGSSAAAGGGVSGAELELAVLVRDQRRLGEGVLGAVSGQLPAQLGDLAGGGHHRDLHAAAGADPLENARSGPGAFDAAHAASTSMPRAWARPCLVIGPCVAGWPPDWRTRGCSPR